MRIEIKKMEIPKGRRILVTSDIHGHGTLFRRLLGKAGFSREDMLFIVGDVIEKGPESLATLRYVMGLSQLENVVVLMGNVDLSRVRMLEELNEENSAEFYDYLLGMRDWHGISIYDEMAQELGITLDSPEEILACKQLLLDSYRRELAFIRGLPAIVETQDYIFVHAGLPCEDLEAVKGRDIGEVLKIDNFMTSGLSFEKYVVVGHWPAAIYDRRIMRADPIIHRGHHIISMDGGCGIHIEGQLNLLVIPESGCPADRITYMFCDGLDRFEALTAQEGSADPVNVAFSNGKVRILEAGEEFTYVEHLESGRRFNALSFRVYNRNGGYADANHTDYLLPVKAGEELALVMRTSEGCLVRKGCVSGWYRGELGRKTGTDEKDAVMYKPRQMGREE